ncbi:DeSI-like protein At4g17486 [Durusdinium trenchii]|uniref:DeSI-like protein At4g17486 n=1 Tax=Durusdinium trenchii TaxID=1381693 RepID=A0ABP0PVU5_9DINO
MFGLGKKPKPARVTLHIYDLGKQFAGVNMVCKAIGTGAFHAGVEVYDTEWSFGGGSNGKTHTGIFHCPPRGCDAHSYREPVDMGTTTMTKQDVKLLIEKLKPEWKGDDYDLLRRNCCHFSDALCISLGVGPLPGWVTSLAGVGAMLRSQVRLAIAAPAAVVDGVMAVANIFNQQPQPETFEAPAPAKAGHEGYGQAHGSPVSPASSASRASRASPEALRPNADSFAPGDQVEIFSHSRQQWCTGYVKLVEENWSPPYLEAVFLGRCLRHGHWRNVDQKGAIGVQGRSPADRL